MIFQFQVRVGLADKRFVQNRSHCSLFQENLLVHITLQLLRWKYIKIHIAKTKLTCLALTALLSSASMPLLPTTTTLYKAETPSLPPQLLSPDHQPYTSSSLPPQYLVISILFHSCQHHHCNHCDPHHDYNGYRPRLVVSEPAPSAYLLQDR